ncbi:MAG: hypothetical protein H7Z14_09135 [Anaerolineae bacterium]|nr:hypothetical protein [Phycisphaerae bacterium]
MLIIRGKWRRRGMGLIGASLIAVAGLRVLHQSPTVDASRANQIGEYPLDQVMPELRFAATPFDEVWGFTAKTTGARIRVDWDELRKIGVDRNSPVTLELYHCELGRLFDALTDAMNANRERQLAFEVLESGEVIVTSEDAVIAQSVERAYDLRPLLSNMPSIARDEAPSAILRMVQDSVQTHTWLDNGGRVGIVRWSNGWIVVRQPARTHQELDRIIEQLYSTRQSVSLSWIDRLCPSD